MRDVQKRCRGWRGDSGRRLPSQCQHVVKQRERSLRSGVGGQVQEGNKPRSLCELGCGTRAEAKRGLTFPLRSLLSWRAANPRFKCHATRYPLGCLSISLNHDQSRLGHLPRPHYHNSKMSGGRETSTLSDPIALARLQILVVPVHPSRDPQSTVPSPLTTPVFDYWSALLRNRQSLRGDEIIRQRDFGHKKDASDARDRFFPSASDASISRVAGANHVHLSFPSQPPAKHLYPLSLLRLTAFPLVVIGVAVDEGGAGTDQNEKEAAWLQAFNRTMATFMPSTSAFPLVKRLLIVPPQLPIPGSSKNARKPKESQDPLLSYAPLDGGDNFAADVLGEVVGEVFGELGELVSALEFVQC